MKKTLVFALVLAMTITSAYAQEASKAQKAINKAVAATQDPKKAAKPATWISLAEEYLKAYEQPTENLANGLTQVQIKAVIGDQKVLNTREQKCTEGVYTVDSYADKDLFYNANGALDFWIVTKPAAEGDLLGNAKKALDEAVKIDAKGSKKDKVAELLNTLHDRYNFEAFAYYQMGDLNRASLLFDRCAETFDNSVINKVDTLSIYYSAYMSMISKNYDVAVKNFRRCIDLGYYQEGNVFSNLADIYRQKQDTTSWKATLEEGFKAYPSSQGVLIGLINLYRETKESPDKIFEFIHAAQSNEPNNASLFYVEGDVHKQLGNVEKAVEFFNKSYEVDSKYIYGILGVGILFYEKAIEIQEKAAQEFDDAKYTELNNQMEATLAKAIEPFNKAFGETEDNDIKAAVAEYLKNIYFRLRDKDASYQGLYEKFNNFLKGE